MNLNTAVIGRRKPIPLDALADVGEAPGGPVGARNVWFTSGWRETPIYRRGQIRPGTTLRGPAVIEQLDTTILVEPEDAVTADPIGNLILRVDGGAA